MIDFCILGSGISGSTIANMLIKKKYSVQVFDKAKGLGGRSSNKRYKNNLNFDHGLQYISPKNKKFLNFIKKLNKIKILKKWEGEHLDFSFEKKIKKTKYIGRYGNNDISKYLLKKIKIKLSSEIKSIKREEKNWKITLENNEIFLFKNLILTCPFPQVLVLARKYIDRKICRLKIKMEPNITVMLAVKDNVNIPVSSIKFNDKILSWAAYENSKKRFKTNLNLWTIQTNINFSKKIINIYKKKKNFFLSKIVNKFCDLTGADKKKIAFCKIHGWKYSYNLKSTRIKSYWNNKYNIGLCGDWFLGPIAENAWLSAINLSSKFKNKKS